MCVSIKSPYSSRFVAWKKIPHSLFFLSLSRTNVVASKSSTRRKKCQHAEGQQVEIS